MYQLKISGQTLEVANRNALLELSMLELVIGYNGLSGKKPIKSFHGKNKAVEAVWGLLQNGSRPKDKDKSPASQPKARKQVEAGEIPACAESVEVKRETARMSLVIRKIKDHPGKGLRVKRWDRYKDGMTMRQVIEMNNGVAGDILFYVANKLMRLEKLNAK